MPRQAAAWPPTLAQGHLARHMAPLLLQVHHCSCSLLGCRAGFRAIFALLQRRNCLGGHRC